MRGLTLRNWSIAGAVLAIDLSGFFLVRSFAPSMVVFPQTEQLIIVPCLCIAAMALLLRTRQPLLVLLIALVCHTIPILAGPVLHYEPQAFNGIAAVVAAGSLGLHSPRRTRDFSFAVLASALVAMANAVLLPTQISGDTAFIRVLSAGSTVATTVIALGVGLAIRNSRDLTASLRERNQLLEDKAQYAARTAVLEERTRIAHELHDTTAHHLSAIAVQTNAARALLQANPAAAATHLEQVSASISQALADVRATVSTLTDAEQQRIPQPDLSSLPDLIQQNRSLGMKLHVTGHVPEGLPGPTQTNLYRIVQEALTNARKHAPEAPVALALGPHSVSVTTAGHFTPGPGTGQFSMAERARTMGATLINEPTDDGWLVQVDWSGS